MEHIAEKVSMKLETKAFELCNRKYANLTELARAMGMSVSQIYRVRQGRRPINHAFIIGAVRAFPEHKLDDLFCVVQGKRRNE